MAFKIARKHLLQIIEMAMNDGLGAEREYPKYTLTADCYRKPRTPGISGIRITWKGKVKP